MKKEKQNKKNAKAFVLKDQNMFFNLRQLLHTLHDQYIDYEKTL